MVSCLQYLIYKLENFLRGFSQAVKSLQGLICLCCGTDDCYDASCDREGIHSGGRCLGLKRSLLGT